MLREDAMTDKTNNTQIQNGSDGVTTTSKKVKTDKFDVHPEAQLPQTYRKNHNLIYSRISMTTHEQNLLALFLIQMQKTEWKEDTQLEISIPASRLADWLEVESKSLAATIKPVALRLQKRTVLAEHPTTHEFESSVLFPTVKYARGKLTMVPNYDLRDFFHDASKGYASVNVARFLRLRGKYSKPMYDLLSRFKTPDKQLYKTDVITLKGVFGLVDDKDNYLPGKKTMKDTSVFVNQALVKSIEEIEEACGDELMFFNTDASGKKRHGIIENKTGNKITSIEFEYLWIDQFIKLHPMDLEAAAEVAMNAENRIRLKKEKITQEETEQLAVAYYVLSTHYEKYRPRCRELFYDIYKHYQKISIEKAENYTESERPKLKSSALDKLDFLLNVETDK